MSTAFTNLQAVPIDGALPAQNTGTAGKALVSNGTSVGWNTVLSMIGTGAGQTSPAAVASAVLPSQSGNAGKYLTTDGNGALSWAVAAGGTATTGVKSITIKGISYTGDINLDTLSVPSATTATTAGNVTGTVAIANGGTGAKSAEAALANLGAAAANHTHAAYAPVASPDFTGVPTAPTAATGTNTTQLATTQFVANGFVPRAGGTITGTADATTKDTGALVVEGGVGVEKSLVVGGIITAGGGFKFADGTTQTSASSSTTPANITYVSSTGANAFGMLVDGRVYVTQGHSSGYDAYSSGTSAPNASGIRALDRISEIPFPTETSPIVKCFISYSINWALTESGNLYVWGLNTYGQLGVGSTVTITKPTLTATGVVEVYCDNQITYGYAHNACRMAIKKADGYVYVTGHNEFGALGIGNTTNQLSWTQLTAAGKDPLYVGNVGSYAGALFVQKADGTIWTSGYNAYGQLGTGTTANISTLTNVTNAWTGGNTNMRIKKVMGGFGYSDDSSYSYSSVAMWLEDGTSAHIRTCGHNDYGQLGNGNTTQQTTPQLVVNKTGTARPVQVEWHGDAPGGVLYVDGTNALYGWGHNSYGHLGLGFTSHVLSPMMLRTGVKRILLCRASITYGYRHATYVELTGGAVMACGYNAHCELGIGEAGDKATWELVRFPYGTKIKTMGTWASTPTGNILVAVTENNQLYAWGYNGQHGIMYPTYGDIQVPMLINAKLVR